MAGFMKGDVVVVPFPFSDLMMAKRRPALVLSVLQDDDLILCQITSRKISDGYSIQLDESDFEQGSLKQLSNIRPNRIFTADKTSFFINVTTGNYPVVSGLKRKWG